MALNRDLLRVKARLDAEVAKRNNSGELCDARPDPLLIARAQNDDAAILLCALYSYGKACLIVPFLRSLDFSLLHADEAAIRKILRRHYYRFQNGEDVVQSFITLRRLGVDVDLYECFMRGYRKEASVIDGINALLDVILACNPYRSRGYNFLFGAQVVRVVGHAPMKRWMMFLRWMVRSDALDLGRWKGVATSDLIMPLDIHTFKVSRALGLLARKRYDLEAALELTCNLKHFDPLDPLRYDFALYRLGQEGALYKGSMV